MNLAQVGLNRIVPSKTTRTITSKDAAAFFRTSKDAPVKVLRLALRVAEEGKVPMWYDDVCKAAGRINVLRLGFRKFHPYAEIASTGTDGGQPVLRYNVLVPRRMPEALGFTTKRTRELAGVLETTITTALMDAKNSRK